MCPSAPDAAAKLVKWAYTLLALAIATPCAAQQLTVQANERKYNGQVWDGAEVYGPAALPTNTPPDLAVCIVPLTGPETCIQRQEGAQLKSLCQNSHSCTFTLSLNPRDRMGCSSTTSTSDSMTWWTPSSWCPTSGCRPRNTRRSKKRLRALMDEKTPLHADGEGSAKRDTFVVARESARTAARFRSHGWPFAERSRNCVE